MNKVVSSSRSWQRLLLVWVLALVSATGYYVANRAALGLYEQEIGTKYNSIAGGATLSSPDDEYYLTPPENWLAGKDWRRTPAVGRGSYVRRTPGYSLWYLAHRVAFGPERVFAALLATQILVFAFSALAFAATLWQRLQSRGPRVLALGLYIFSPWFLSYSFYTITEALSVPLVVFMLYFASRGYSAASNRKKIWSYAVATAFWSMAALTRPFAGLSVLTLAVIISYDYLLRPTDGRPLGWAPFFRQVLAAAVVPVLLFGAWTIRNYRVTGELVVLETYAHPESIDGYKPAFNAAWDLYGAAGVQQAAFYQYFAKQYYAVGMSGQPAPALLENALQTFPADKRAAMGGDTALRSALQAYQQLLLDKYYPYVSNPVRPMPATYSAQEMAVVAQFRALRQALYARQPKMRIISPLLVLKDIVVHSNASNLALFTQPVRAHYLLVNIERLLLLAVHLALYLALALTWVQALRRRATAWQLALMLPATILILFLCFSFGSTEQRYLLPLLPLLVLNAAILLDGRLLGNRITSEGVTGS